MITQKNNLIVILCDQLRRQALGCYGDPNAHTPNLDAMAANGAKFEAACSTFPVCVPFRFTMMTGQYAHTRMVPAIAWRMSPSERTLADEFNDAGYQTSYFGKWHLFGGYYFLPGYSAKHEGLRSVPKLYRGNWQYWRGFELRNSHFDTYYFADDDPAPHKIDGYQTDGLFELSMQYISSERDKSKPFFSVISVEPPHPPFEAPPELEEKWLQKDLVLPENFYMEKIDPQLEEYSLCKRGTSYDPARNLKIYYAMLENLDQNIGRLMSFLDKNGLCDNTRIMFVSDHGELCGSHGLREKQHPFEESIGIPLLISGPGIPSGTTVTDPVAAEDLFPSLLGLAGLKSDTPNLPGADLTPLVEKTEDKLGRPGVMLEFVWETRMNTGMPYNKFCYRGFRSEHYKYIVAGDLAGYKPWMFFDIEKDPGEMHNLIDDPGYQNIIACHHRWLYDRMVETDDDAPLSPAYGLPGLRLPGS